MGFTFDDVAAAKGAASSLEEMKRLIAESPHNAERIKPYLGGEEINNDPIQKHHRYVIDFEDFPLRREASYRSWFLNEGTDACEKRRRDWLQDGIVPSDYPDPVAEDWPLLIDIVKKSVKPERMKQNDAWGQKYWWRFLRSRPEMRNATKELQKFCVLARVSPSLYPALVSSNAIYNEKVVIFADDSMSFFASLQSSIFLIWTRSFSTTLKDDISFAPSDCFSNFPMPVNRLEEIEVAGKAYHDYRAQLMIETNKGLTPTYNRFHDQYDEDHAIQRLRDLHAEMDRAVLRAYGWHDLADAADPVFLTEETETEFTYQGRLFWPSDFRDEVLARLLDLNRARHAAEANAGIAIATAPDAPHSAATDRIRARQMDFGLDAGPLFDRTSE
jgi:hypothetical protein